MSPDAPPKSSALSKPERRRSRSSHSREFMRPSRVGLGVLGAIGALILGCQSFSGQRARRGRAQGRGEPRLLARQIKEIPTLLPRVVEGFDKLAATRDTKGDFYGQQENKKPNMLVIWGDDIGVHNVSAYSH